MSKNMSTKRFTQEEDNIIFEFAEKFKKKGDVIPWKELVRFLPKYTNKDLSHRYHNLQRKIRQDKKNQLTYTDPHPVHVYTEEECKELMKLYKTYGKDYCEIARHFSVRNVSMLAIQRKIKRLLKDQPISFPEQNYPTQEDYDFSMEIPSSFDCEWERADVPFDVDIDMFTEM